MKRPRRQDWNGELIENGAFYVFKTQALRDSGSRLSGKIAAFEMSEDTLAEIDTPTGLILTKNPVARKDSNYISVVPIVLLSSFRFYCTC